MPRRKKFRVNDDQCADVSAVTVEQYNKVVDQVIEQAFHGETQNNEDTTPRMPSTSPASFADPVNQQAIDFKVIVSLDATCIPCSEDNLFELSSPVTFQSYVNDPEIFTLLTDYSQQTFRRKFDM